MRWKMQYQGNRNKMVKQTVWVLETLSSGPNKLVKTILSFSPAKSSVFLLLLWVHKQERAIKNNQRLDDQFVEEPPRKKRKIMPEVIANLGNRIDASSSVDDDDYVTDDEIVI